VTRGPLDTYLQELAHALLERGHEAARIVDEAREHLVDAVEDGVRRGLAREDAEREALERFGPPDLIAAQAPPERSRMMARVTAALDTIIGHWRWLTAATAVAALLTHAASFYLLPTRYRSEMLILVSKPRGAGDTEASSHESLQRLQTISNTILSRPRLERVARDFGLDKGHDANAPIADAVEQMRRNISIEVAGAGEPVQFRVSFQSPDPRLAMRVTERIASLFVQENLEQSDGATDSMSRFLDSEIVDVRFRLAELESQLEAARAQKFRVPRADMLLFEVLQDRYRNLLTKREDAKLARRVVGEQYRILEGARVPDRPIGPSRASVNATGAVAGLALSIGALAFRRSGR
jgi:uncharacterized protein involved in exopolysaccharide biosynthesis